MRNDSMALLKFLKKHHTGKENAITSKQLGLKFKLDRGIICRYVSVLRRNGIPICSCNSGYFFPDSYSEVLETVSRFNKYRTTLAVTGADMIRASLY